MSTRPIQSKAPGMIAAAPWPIATSLGWYHPVTTPICPTRPQVPIPELTAAPFISILNRQVAIGPVIIEVKQGASQTLGFLIMLGI